MIWMEVRIGSAHENARGFAPVKVHKMLSEETEIGSEKMY